MEKKTFYSKFNFFFFFFCLYLFMKCYMRWRDTDLEYTELSSENTWVPMLVVVALVSAMLGAVLMITALKCRR